HLNAGWMGAVVAKLRNEESLFHLRILVPIGKSVLLLRAGGGDIYRVLLTFDANLLFALQIDVALNPGAELVRVGRDVIFGLASLDETQKANAFGGVNAKRPLVLGPVVIRRRKGATRGG